MKQLALGIVRRINKFIDSTPYWILHGIVAVMIQIDISILSWMLSFSSDNLSVGTASGIAFYVGREIRDLEKLGFFDWKGFVSPIVFCFITHFLFKFFLS